MTAADRTRRRPRSSRAEPPARIRWQRLALHLFLIAISLVWLFPFLWTLYMALRPYGDIITAATCRCRVASPSTTSSPPGTRPRCRTSSSTRSSSRSRRSSSTLLLSSMLGFAVSRFSFRFNLSLLMMFTAGNLLPPQVIIVPLYRMYLLLPLPAP